MQSGETFPPLKLQVEDENGLVDFSTADAIEVRIKGDAGTISGPGVPISPPEADADGIHNWNLQYDFAAGDTDVPTADAPIQVKVTWDAAATPPQIQIFPNTAAGAPTLKIDQAN